MLNPSEIDVPKEGIEKPKVLEGRRGVLAKILAGTVASIAYGKVHGVNVGDQELIEGIAKAEVSGQLLELPDNIIEKIDENNPNIGRSRRIIERSLDRIRNVMLKLRTHR